jgi:RNA polymerase sigma factor (sigma-70 family)
MERRAAALARSLRAFRLGSVFEVGDAAPPSDRLSEVANPLLSSPAAWERLIESVKPASLLLVIERRMSAGLKGVQTAEDILQEALLHAWRDRRQFEWRGLGSFRSWLLGIIDHRIHDAADRYSAKKRDAGGPVVAFSALRGAGATTTSAEPDFPASSTTPSKLATYREEAEVMRQALDGLPEEFREIVGARLFEQCPLEEIAARLGLGVEAVRHRFRNGSELYVRRLRAALGPRPSSAPAESAPPASPESSP